MSYVRILVDGYSLLHAWRWVRMGAAPHTESARDQLVKALQDYSDASGFPVSVFFDGAGRKMSAHKQSKDSAAIEIIYSKSGQTADDLIERAAVRLREYGQVLVITNDMAERRMVFGAGCQFSSCENFVNDYESAMNGLQENLKRHNLSQVRQFRDRRK